MRVQVLSSGSGGNALLVRAGEVDLLVDAGLALDDLEERLAQARVPVRRLDAVLLTHGHLDHARSVGLLARKADATVYCAERVMKNLAVRKAPRFVTLRPGTPSLERYRSYKLVQYKSFQVRARLDWADGDEGVLFAHGDQGGGYSMWIEDGRVTAAWNGYGQMTLIDGGAVQPGVRELTLNVDALAGMRCNVRVGIDGAEVGMAEDLPLLMAMAPFQGIDVGIDRRSPVSWDLYERRGTFAYRGTLRDVSWIPGDSSPEEPTQFAGLLREHYMKYE